MLSEVTRVLAILLIWGNVSACASHSTNSDYDRQIVDRVLRMVAEENRCNVCLVQRASESYRPWLAPTPAERKLRELELSRGILTNYSKRNRLSVPISAVNTLPFRSVDQAEVKKFFAAGAQEGWRRLSLAYGKRVGLIAMSLPAYSDTGDIAVITYSYDEGPLDGQTDYVILTCQQGVWKISERRHLVLS